MEKQAPPRQLAADPGFLLSRVGAAVRAGFKDVLAGYGIRPQQYQVLLILEAAGGASQQQELCTAARIDSGNMVELLDGLERLRYARRARDDRDRRRYIVTITPRGQAALEELRGAVAAYTDRFLSPLSAAERKRLSATLAKLFATTAEGRTTGSDAG
jgi:DNA-binding MarR family transcriptional regulator